MKFLKAQEIGKDTLGSMQICTHNSKRYVPGKVKWNNVGKDTTCVGVCGSRWTCSECKATQRGSEVLRVLLSPQSVSLPSQKQCHDFRKPDCFAAQTHWKVRVRLAFLPDQDIYLLISIDITSFPTMHAYIIVASGTEQKVTISE